VPSNSTIARAAKYPVTVRLSDHKLRVDVLPLHGWVCRHELALGYWHFGPHRFVPVLP
jgi:hypothetical protein